jgi:uncharacterized protein YndB with AHSA1/START domain
MADQVTAQEITLTRTYEAPRELVWKAWTEPERLAQWFGARGWSNPLERITMDVRPGGEFSVTAVSDEDGTEMTTKGIYREVVPPERLVLEEPSEDSWHESAVSEVTLTDLGDGRTELVLRATIHTTDEMRAMAEAGMAGSLDRLAEHLEG